VSAQPGAVRPPAARRCCRTGDAPAG
jgi:hypothetical protein